MHMISRDDSGLGYGVVVIVQSLDSPWLVVQEKGGRPDGSNGDCLLSFSLRAAAQSAFPLCRAGCSAGSLLSVEDEATTRRGAGWVVALGPLGMEPGTSSVTAWVMDEIT